MVTDQGSEYKGYNFEQITDLGVELINLQAYRAEQKGPVEKSFGVITIDFCSSVAMLYLKVSPTLSGTDKRVSSVIRWSYIF